MYRHEYGLLFESNVRYTFEVFCIELYLYSYMHCSLIVQGGYALIVVLMLMLFWLLVAQIL